MDVNSATLLEIANLLARACSIDDMELAVQLTRDIELHNLALRGSLRNQWFKLLQYANNRQTNRVYELVENILKQDPTHKDLIASMNKVTEIFDGTQQHSHKNANSKKEKSVLKVQSMEGWRRLTLPEIGDLSRDLVKNYVSLDRAKQALEDIGVFPATIPNAGTLQYYYVNIIKHLEPKRMLVQWLQKLAIDLLDPEDYGYVFVREWLNLLVKVDDIDKNKKDKANYIREKIWRPGKDLLKPVNWLYKGYKSIECVANLLVGDGGGTGFLIAKDLLVTNWHVISDENVANGAIVEFDYFRNEENTIAPQAKTLDPENVFFSLLDEEREVDIAIISLSEPQEDRYIPKIRENIGSKESVYILQHPDSNDMKIGLNNNEIKEINETSLRYMSPTAKGSSGSPIFDHDWNIIGVHWGKDEKRNIGTRISKVMSILKNHNNENAQKIYQKILDHQR
ncbi:serine protease [Candidatus Uabimicrobium sp. HlEnr_7]|uniref:trypsin-like serine peptidase n=1 Tax=Candidatus Uabimicrobium helgolandensis TaxID=3095367 RepID=UPI00355680AA